MVRIAGHLLETCRSPSQRTEELSKGNMMFDNLMFVAADIPALSRLERIFPYTLGKMMPYEPRFLADWPALLYKTATWMQRRSRPTGRCWQWPANRR
jgi:hypothetical protein